MGINLGDVIVEGEQIHGDGVNIAARLEGLAKGGGICISGTVYDQEVGHTAMARVLDLRDVLELIGDRLNQNALSQHELKI